MGSGGATKRGVIAAVLAVFGGVGLPGHGFACSPDRLDIRWPGGQASFAVEVADDGQERAKGLMFRERMPTSAGMLFVYDSPRRASFWMKNTLIPLDMIFADDTGRVTRIHPDAVPGDLSSIDGGDGVLYILEVNGGLAKRLRIPEGAEMRHVSIPDARAAWPCGD
jgi:uncharacterized protein